MICGLIEHSIVSKQQELPSTKRSANFKFLGHLIDHSGIQPDPDKTIAITNMPPPTNISELRQFMGMINQSGKFSCNLAQITEPSHALLQQRNSWMWNQVQSESFACVKEEITKPTVLALFDINADVKVSADASSYGLGAALLQKTNSSWKPVAFASRVMSDTERRYAQVEKRPWPLRGPVRDSQHTFSANYLPSRQITNL